MSLETSIDGLAAAIVELAHSNLALTRSFALAAARDSLPQTEPAAEAPAGRRGPGRPRKTAEAAAAAPEAPVASPEPEAAPTVAPVAPTSPAAPPEAPEGLSKGDVQRVLIEVVKRLGRDACGSLCQAHGGPNLSSLDPSVWPALHADALKLLSTAAADA
jgi:hypothetical protein